MYSCQSWIWSCTNSSGQDRPIEYFIIFMIFRAKNAANMKGWYTYGKHDTHSVFNYRWVIVPKLNTCIVRMAFISFTTTTLILVWRILLSYLQTYDWLAGKLYRSLSKLNKYLLLPKFLSNNCTIKALALVITFLLLPLPVISYFILCIGLIFH